MQTSELINKNSNKMKIGTVTTNDLRYVMRGRSFEDLTITISWSSTFIYESILEEITYTRQLESSLKEINRLSEERVIEILSHFTDKSTLLEIRRNKIDVRKLAALLLWISSNYREYGEPKLDIAFDPETKEYQFLSIIIPNCDWNTWKTLTREIKANMKKSNLKDMNSRVAIVCLKGLLEEKS